MKEFSVLIRSNMIRDCVVVIAAESEEKAREIAIGVAPYPGFVQQDKAVLEVEVVDEETIANTVVSAEEVPPPGSIIL